MDEKPLIVSKQDDAARVRQGLLARNRQGPSRQATGLCPSQRPSWVCPTARAAGVMHGEWAAAAAEWRACTVLRTSSRRHCCRADYRNHCAKKDDDGRACSRDAKPWTHKTRVRNNAAVDNETVEEGLAMRWLRWLRVHCDELSIMAVFSRAVSDCLGGLLVVEMVRR